MPRWWLLSARFRAGLSLAAVGAVEGTWSESTRLPWHRLDGRNDKPDWYPVKMVPGSRFVFARRGLSVARQRTRLVSALVTFLLLCGGAIALPSVARGEAVAAACTGNAIVCENQLPGTPQSVWDVEGAGDQDIQGFATQISVNVGETVQFKIDTNAAAYRIEIYRLGFYGGNGARKIADVTPSMSLPQTQPACATDATTEIYDCGTWGVSASWAVPATAVSGVYIARLIRTDNGDSSHIPFIIRDDSSHSQAVFQTSDPTWQAYNTYGQSDFYQGLANGRAYKVSYNRPIVTRGSTGGRDFLFSNEYPTIRFMEQNGYDVSYISGLDTDIRGSLLTNHRTFISTGHDEYWSDGQRSNVAKARDAGVNLAFFSGNEVYWKTRWEPSQDGSATVNRTLVCYKDTWANAKIDPLGPTSTWRDPRFGGNGTGPENSLTGTLYMSNNTDLPITVSSEEGKTRLWRNTSLVNQPSGTSTALAAHTIGYESDEDLDNGFRPAGLIRLSTTTGPTPQYLQDFGSTVAAGNTTHHLTLYRAASGALVFGAGTIQWGWGLDADHDGTAQPADVRMRQATVNLFADMGMMATSIAPDLQLATKTTDTTAPTASITSPAANETITQGSLVTVTGTAVDSGGGVVAGVEVSVDGGTSWHPAAGTSSFSYTGVLSSSGARAVRARAIDDSANIQPVSTDVAITTNCPCSIFGAAPPQTASVSDTTSLNLGVKFTSSAAGYISGIRFFKGTGNVGTHVGTLYTSAGQVLATVTFSGETASGWQTANFASAVQIAANTTYIAAYTAPNGRYAADSNYFASMSHTAAALTALGGPSNQTNGVYGAGSRFPTSSYKSTNYYVDVVYSVTDITPLNAGSASPLNGASSTSASVVSSAIFSRAVDPASIVMTIADSANVAVSGAVTYDSASRKVSLNPTSPLAAGMTYTVRVSATSPDVGPMAAPLTWSFTTAQPAALPGVCPCTIFNDADSPAAGPTTDKAVELGMAFTTEDRGTVTGVRFYKDATNVGTHTLSIWTSSGTLLATATVPSETASGWQQASFANPVALTPGVVYLASYRNPNGRYSYTSAGLAKMIDRSPLHTPANAGRYTYGTGGPTTASGTNYFVDPVFAPAVDAPPEVAVVDPADTATSVPTGAKITVTFSASIQASSVAITVTAPDGTVVPGTVGNESPGRSATFLPTSPWAASSAYTVSISGARSTSGTSMTAPFVTRFKTSGVASCPCSVLASTALPLVSDSTDTGSVSIGLRFTPSVSGVVSGARYYADATNTGTHTASLFSSSGVRLATATYPSSSSVGWRSVTFDSPVAVTAGATYVVSTFMPVGHYSVSAGFFNTSYVNTPLTGLMGLYTYGSDSLPSAKYNNSNYFVDVAFVANTGSAKAPSVSALSPPSGSTGVSRSATVSGTFDVAINTATLKFTLTGPTGAAVTGAVAYVASTGVATLTPSPALAAGTTYVAKLEATSSAGVAMTAAATWSFTTGSS